MWSIIFPAYSNKEHLYRVQAVGVTSDNHTRGVPPAHTLIVLWSATVVKVNFKYPVHVKSPVTLPREFSVFGLLKTELKRRYAGTLKKFGNFPMSYRRKLT